MPMITLKLHLKEKEPLKLLLVGAHSDDIEIGCGGAVLKLIEEYPDVEAHWVVLSSTRDRAEEARTSAELFLDQISRKSIVVQNFKDSFFPYIGSDIKAFLEVLKKTISPGLVFTHYRHDLHQDHRLVSELTWNTFRDHMILEYEIIKYDGDLGSPNAFVPISRHIAAKKIQNILEVFKSQGHRAWFTEDAFYSIMRIRGLECNAPEKFAEGFYCRKAVL